MDSFRHIDLWLFKSLCEESGIMLYFYAECDNLMYIAVLDISVYLMERNCHAKLVSITSTLHSSVYILTEKQ